MNLSTDTLIAATGMSTTTAAMFEGPLNTLFDRFQVNTPLRVAMFLAQAGHESAGFRILREIWGPTPGQSAYEGRKDLGNVQTGDGSLYRGRGVIQITGRANYTSVAAALNIDCVLHPQMLETPQWGTASAGWFWSTRSLNSYADKSDFAGATRRINGGLNGYDDRMARYQKALPVLTEAIQ